VTTAAIQINKRRFAMSKRLKLLLAGIVLAAASGTAAAHGGVSFGITLGVPVAPVYVAPPPAVYYEPVSVYYAPAPRVYYAPAYYGPPAVVIRADRGFRHGYHRRHWR